MDYILDFCDRTIFTPHVYPASWPEDDMLRQFLTLFTIVNVGGVFIYLIPATLAYFLWFDHNLMKHPHFLKNQVWPRRC